MAYCVITHMKVVSSLVVIQVTSFSCGGIAIGVCTSHKIADACTIVSFIRDWAATTSTQSDDGVLSPLFLSTSVLTPDHQPILSDIVEKGNYVCVSRIFMFSASKLADLKTMATTSQVHDPTRVEVVTAFIYKCAMAASRAISGSSRPSILFQAINLRPRLVPPLPDNSIGNFSLGFSIMTEDEREDQKLHKIVGSLRNGMTQFCDKYTKNRTANECYSLICESIKETKEKMDDTNVHDIYFCASRCNYPLSQVNFGWGEPIWVGTSSSLFRDIIQLHDAPEEGGNGIEALVTFEEEKMAIFERDEELLAFASLYHSASDK